MSTTKHSPVRKLLSDVGAAFGKFFTGDSAGGRTPPEDVDDGRQEYEEQGLISQIVMTVVPLLFFVWVATYWYQNRVEMLTIVSRISNDIKTFVEPATESVREFLVDCEQLEAGLIADLQCIQDDNCMMTRDELLASQERQDAYNKYCAQK